MTYVILNHKRHWFYFTVSVLGTCMIVWEVLIYRITVIDKIIPILIILAIGTIAFLFDNKNYKMTYEIDFVNIFSWAQNILSWGFLSCTLFMVTNKYLANTKSTIQEYKIDNVSVMSGSKPYRHHRKPLVRIEYNGGIKELMFSNKYLSQINDYKSVKLETSKGFWGYDVIKSKELKK